MTLTPAQAAYIDNLYGLDGRVAVVTGASSGIGRHLAACLSQAGAAIIAVARSEAALEELVTGITETGGDASLVTAALSIDNDFKALAANLAEPFGAPDILVNAAGVNLRQHANEVTVAAWQETLDLNLSVPFFLAQALVPGMRRKGGGNVINIASLQTTRAFANGIAYGASKGGIGQLTRAMAEAWSADGIVANAIAPGFFPTSLTAPVFADDKVSAHHAGMTAVGRNGRMEDLDGAAVFLASRASAYVTGQILPVDGGYTSK